MMNAFGISAAAHSRTDRAADGRANHAYRRRDHQAATSPTTLHRHEEMGDEAREQARRALQTSMDTRQ